MERPSRGFFECLAIVLAVAAAYSNCLRGVYVLDDPGSILSNLSIRHLSHLGAILAPPTADGITVAGRPMLNLSLAINYAISGTASWSYHLANAAIHLAAALVLLGILRRLATPGVAFAATLLWAVHPLNTEAVTYVVQRAESLMGLFYLLTIFLFLKERRLLSCLVCLLGMATKEVMVSAPLVVLLVDRFAVSGSFAEAWRRHKGYYLGLASTWILLGALVWHTRSRGGTSGFNVGISPWQYWATQPLAIVHYLKLAILPHPLVFDYGTDWNVPGISLAAALVLILGLAGVTVAGIGKNRASGILGFMFFAILAPTSLIPGIRQTAAEQRMYLALIPVLVVLVAFLRTLVRSKPLRLKYAGLALLAVPAAAATFRRNQDYASTVRLYGGDAAVRPDNVYAQSNYATALLFAHRLPEAAEHFQAALKLHPLADSENNLGNVYFLQGRYDEAEERYRRAIALSIHGFAEAHDNLAEAYLRQNRLGEARQEIQIALRLNPNLGGAHANLGNVLLKEGHLDQALPEFAFGVKLAPGNIDARIDYAHALRVAHQPLQALQQYNAASRVDPLDGNIFFNWAGALLELGRLPQAKLALQRAIVLNPQNQAARKILGSLPATP